MPTVESATHAQVTPTNGRIDLLGDYWADFFIFRRDARISHRNGDVLRTQRYLRAGLFSFMNYLIGLANRWQPAGASTIEVRSTVAISERLAALALEHEGPSPPREDLDFLTRLISQFADLQPSDEEYLVRSLDIDRIDLSEQRILAWLDEFTRATGLTRPGDAATSGRFDTAMSVPDYSDFDKVKDDPLAFQDPPGTWEELAPDLVPTPDVD